MRVAGFRAYIENTCADNAFACAWRAFWSNAGAAANAPVETRLKLLTRCVQSVLNFRWSRWPPSASMACNLRTLQRRMVACIVRVQWVDGESFEAYARRKGRAVTRCILEAGCWVHLWQSRWSAWNAHLARHPDMPACQLLRYRNSLWLQRRRATFAPSNPSSTRSWSISAGRTDTRATSGVVHTRWEAGAAFICAS